MGIKYILNTLLILLVACQPAIQTVPTSEYQPLVDVETEVIADACAGINCPNDQVCKEGTCSCPTGEKLCDGKCIDKDACCTDNDCDTGLCVDGDCKVAEECKFGEELKKGTCGCEEDKIYCSSQEKCIGRGDCCVHTECDNFERCVPTGWRVSFCIRIEEKKVCKMLADNERVELFDVKGNDFRVDAVDWLSDGSITFTVNNESITLGKDQTISIDELNATVFQEGIDVTGGFCKEDTQE